MESFDNRFTSQVDFNGMAKVKIVKNERDPPLRLIINKINKVQWVDFKLENVLVSLHSLNVLVMEIGWTDVGSGGYRIGLQQNISLVTINVQEFVLAFSYTEDAWA
jgi:hypothetical protein